MQVLGTRFIIKAFKAISVQTWNVEAYSTFIGFELDKKTD